MCVGFFSFSISVFLCVRWIDVVSKKNELVKRVRVISRQGQEKKESPFRRKGALFESSNKNTESVWII